MTENEIRKKVVETAQAWLGYKESDGSFRKIIDTYNGHKPLARGYKVQYSDEWCATFVSAVAIKCGLTDIIPTECSCNRMIALHKAKGTWKESDSYTPKMGDIIMYDWQDTGAGDNTGVADHVGIVVSVVGKIIKVIEGNKSEQVAYRNISVNGRYIRGFCLPDYASKARAEKKSVDEIAQEVIAGKWGTGEVRKKRLTDAGYDAAAVQARVNAILGGTTTITNKKSVTEIAKEVIAGKWSVGEERKKMLTAAGYDYEEVQKMVNSLLK